MIDRDYAIKVKETLKESISQLDFIKWMFLSNPEKDFTRTRKISFGEFINICLQMEGGSLQNELFKYFDFSEDVPTKSAFCQQRAKVSSEAIKFLFCIFTEMLMEMDAPNTFRGYRLLACDGSDINIPYDPSDKETYHQNADKKGYNQLHLNAFFDILNGIYIDCVLEPDRKSHERAAFNVMVDRYKGDVPAIIMADRGYEGYNVFGHLLESGQKFIIRLKDDDSNGIISAYEFTRDENGEFDCDIETILTWRQTNEIKSDLQTYTIVSRKKFDFYDESPYYQFNLRIVCIETEPERFVYLATNLDRDEFSPRLMKELYHLRWGEENSFRDLKYTIDLVHFHCKKRDYVEQEAWARLILYNFCEAITRHVTVTRQTQGDKTRKHDYKINFATAACICKAFLKRSDGEIDPCRLIGKFLIPIRPNRTAPRNLKPQSAKSFLYRAA